MAKIGHRDEDRTDGNGIPLHRRAEIFTSSGSPPTSLEAFQAAHLDVFAFEQMASLSVRCWVTVPLQYRHTR